MPLLKDEVRRESEERFKKLSREVKLVVFTQKIECPYCEQNRELAEEVASLSPKIGLEVYNFALDKGKANQYKIDKIPAIVVEGGKDYGIRFYGIPGGYEFNSFISSIMEVSTNESGLSPDSKVKIAQIKQPVHIQVFVTLTCPYCPSAVQMAHKIALENDYIIADMIEVSEFPHLVNKYGVMGVPKTIVNEKIQFEGGVSESLFVEQVMKGSNIPS